MTATINLRVNRFQINFRHFLIILGIIASTYLISHYIIAKLIATETPTLKIEDVSSIAEEVYKSGSIEALKNLPLDAALAKKLADEIADILKKTTDYPGCEVYFLHATKSDNYPVLGYGDELIGLEYLNVGEVWKVGMTGNGQNGRYPSDTYYKSSKNGITLNRSNLEYHPVFTGT